MQNLEASQCHYAARPFAVRWIDSHHSGTFRFNTFDEAFEYVQEQWKNIQAQVAKNRHIASNLRSSYLETPTERTPLRWFLLVDDVSSY